MTQHDMSLLSSLGTYPYGAKRGFCLKFQLPLYFNNFAMLVEHIPLFTINSCGFIFPGEALEQFEYQRI
jgi:hypothetical protein